jgi:hypothetical protein
MIVFDDSGSFEQTTKWLERMQKEEVFKTLDRFGQMGVDALRRNTPVDSGISASSWTYEVKRERGKYSIVWNNTNNAGDVPVVILIQYGHGTGTGGWVQGRDFINPALMPLFDFIANEVWKGVTNG